jgi:hypothetical protein
MLTVNDVGLGRGAVSLPTTTLERRVFVSLSQKALGHGDDLANSSPVLWGGVTPDATNPELGSGIALARRHQIPSCARPSRRSPAPASPPGEDRLTSRPGVTDRDGP